MPTTPIDGADAFLFRDRSSGVNKPEPKYGPWLGANRCAILVWQFERRAPSSSAMITAPPVRHAPRGIALGQDFLDAPLTLRFRLQLAAEFDASLVQDGYWTAFNVKEIARHAHTVSSQRNTGEGVFDPSHANAIHYRGSLEPQGFLGQLFWSYRPDQQSPFPKLQRDTRPCTFDGIGEKAAFVAGASCGARGPGRSRCRHGLRSAFTQYFKGAQPGIVGEPSQSPRCGRHGKSGGRPASPDQSLRYQVAIEKTGI
jgi:hypothetical protein